MSGIKWADADEIQLPTGRKVYANCLIFGMTAFGGLDVSEGYDGGVSWAGATWLDGEGAWTYGEKRALADHMIRRWNEWADAPQGGGTG